jgi:AraC-like DNA-binding protein
MLKLAINILNMATNYTFEHKSRIRRYVESLHSYYYGYERFDPPLKVVSAVISRWGVGDAFGASNRPNLSLSIITSGSARYVQNGRQGVLKLGDIYLAQKNKNQRFETGPEGFVHKRSVVIEGAALDLLMQTMGLTETDTVHAENPASTIGLFRRAYRVVRERPPGAATELSRIAYELLVECGQTITSAYPLPVARAIEYMRRNLDSRLPLSAIAREAGMSVRHCNRLFQQVVGVSPVQFHLNERMNLARSILMNTQQSVKQAAIAVGYDNPLRFSAQFRKMHGVSPKYYRQGLPRPGRKTIRRRSSEHTGEANPARR